MMQMNPQLKEELLKKQWEMQKKREERQSVELQQQGLYVHTHKSMEQERLLIEKSAYTLKKLGNIRDIVSANMPGVYDRIDDIRQADRVDQRAVELHHSRGAQYLENGAKVLEFDIAGSGFKQFRAMHKGFHGKYMVNEHGEKEVFKKQIKATFLNRVFSWIPGVRSVKEVEEENRRREQMAYELVNKYHLGEFSSVKEANKLLKEAQQRAIDEQYGQRQTIGNKRMEHVRKKVSEDQRKTRITMAGPLAVWGGSNSGDYSIENLRKYMLDMGKDYLERIFRGWQEPGDEHDINLIMRGHSRGGVAVAEGAMMIKHWVRTYYPQYLHRVKFDLIQFDPVPGFGSYSEHASVNHSGQEVIERDGVQMEPLGENAETTVLYSMHTEHSFFFTPQVIKGAKRVILTPFKHSLDLGTADRTQERAHRRGFTDANTGAVYRSSGINDLERGVYMVNEQNVIVKMDNYQQVERIVNQYVENAKQQGERHRIMLEVARTWFENNNG